MVKMLTSGGELAHNCSTVIEAHSHLWANGTQVSFIARFALMQHKDTVMRKLSVNHNVDY